MEKQNVEIGKIQAVSVTCKDCGTVFVMGNKEIKWYSQKMGWSLPGRCKACREKRREVRKDAVPGISHE